MASYVRNFVTGHGINFEVSKRNSETFQKGASKWPEIFSMLDIKPNSVLMFCGAKNNGKSSLLRYTINRYNHSPRQEDDSDKITDIDASEPPIDENSTNDRYAYYIDCDPGQPEMTTPGIVSGHIIRTTDRPLISPTYMNISIYEPVVQSSVGGTNMSVNPKLYVENCRYIYNQVMEHRQKSGSNGPIFINTMGHIRNVGLAMLTDLIKLFRPTNLVVLNVEGDPMRTIYADLSPRAMHEKKASFYYEISNRSKKLKYQYDVHNLDFSFTDSSSIATRNRTALQLSYLALMPEVLYKPIMQVSPKWVYFRDNFIYCVSSYPLKEGIILELLYHSWVHLTKLVKPVRDPKESFDGRICNIIDEVGENSLVGCGIVADIDLENGRLAMITPLSQSDLLDKVNCVIKPLSIQVPREMLIIGT